jgi:hypothetical protein
MTQLMHIVYASEATVPFTDDSVKELLLRARAHNASLDVSGILLLIDRSFFQILEGTAEAVEPLYEKIARDRRHKRVVRLLAEPIDERDFRDWSMGLAKVTSRELAALPGFSDFFVRRATLDALSEGMTRRLLGEFRAGKWRARVEA